MKTILFLISFNLLLPAFLLAEPSRVTGTTAGIETPITKKVDLKSSPSTTDSTTHSIILDSAINFLDVLNKYARLIGAAASLCAVLVALYLGSWREIRRKPKLGIYFNENKSYPYFHKLSFGSFNTRIDFEGNKIAILIPGFNIRVKVANEGKSTAKNVQARIEKIEFKNQNNIAAPTTYYHPTKVKWSGESTWDPIDIVPQSHFFLDIFHSINLSSQEIASFTERELIKQKINFDSALLVDIVKQDIKPDEEIYWNVWVDSPDSRGVPARYYFQGDIVIYFIVNSENCEPLKFEALVNWTMEAWNEPNVKIRMINAHINNDEGRT
jgi:hypothetical protein